MGLEETVKEITDTLKKEFCIIGKQEYVIDTEVDFKKYYPLEAENPDFNQLKYYTSILKDEKGELKGVIAAAFLGETLVSLSYYGKYDQSGSKLVNFGTLNLEDKDFIKKHSKVDEEQLQVSLEGTKLCRIDGINHFFYNSKNNNLKITEKLFSPSGYYSRTDQVAVNAYFALKK